MTETKPLLSNNDGNGYYFLNDGSKAPSPSKLSSYGGSYVDGVPAGANADEFEPRKLTPKRQVVTTKEKEVGLFDKLFGRDSKHVVKNPKPSIVKKRTAPIKVEPKVFFANERTFLAWMHIAVILAGSSIALMAFSDESAGSQLYGIVISPVAVAFIVYAMYQYARRASMIRHKHPGPYDDTVGPTVLCIMLMLSIVAQFAIKLHSLSYL